MSLIVSSAICLFSSKFSVKTLSALVYAWGWAFASSWAFYKISICSSASRKAISWSCLSFTNWSIRASSSSFCFLKAFARAWAASVSALAAWVSALASSSSAFAWVYSSIGSLGSQSSKAIISAWLTFVRMLPPSPGYQYYKPWGSLTLPSLGFATFFSSLKKSTAIVDLAYTRFSGGHPNQAKKFL